MELYNICENEEISCHQHSKSVILKSLIFFIIDFGGTFRCFYSKISEVHMDFSMECGYTCIVVLFNPVLFATGFAVFHNGVLIVVTDNYF